MLAWRWRGSGLLGLLFSQSCDWPCWMRTRSACTFWMPPGIDVAAPTKEWTSTAGIPYARARRSRSFSQAAVPCARPSESSDPTLVADSIGVSRGYSSGSFLPAKKGEKGREDDGSRGGYARRGAPPRARLIRIRRSSPSCRAVGSSPRRVRPARGNANRRFASREDRGGERFAPPSTPPPPPRTEPAP